MSNKFNTIEEKVNDISNEISIQFNTIADIMKDINITMQRQMQFIIQKNIDENIR